MHQIQNERLSNALSQREVYAALDLMYVNTAYEPIKYYLYKYKDNNYRKFCTLQQHVERVYAENITNLAAIVGYPFGQQVHLQHLTLTRCDEIELWFDYARVARGPEKLFNTIRKITLQAHAVGVRVRVATELRYLSLPIINQWLEVCRMAAVDHIQTGYGLTTLNEKWLPEMRDKLGAHFKLKAVGGISSIAVARQLLAAGADIIGSTTI